MMQQIHKSCFILYVALVMQHSDRESTDRVGGKRDIESKYYQSIITKRHLYSSWST